MDNEFIFLVLLPASLFDLKCCRIPNPLLAAGLFISLFRRLELQGLTGVWPWLAGMIIPLFLYYLLFRLRMFGASDGKLLAVAGGYVGVPGVFSILFFSLVAGAVISVIKMAITGTFKDRMMRLLIYVNSTVKSHKITPYYNREKDGDTAVIPFGIAIGIGTLFVI